MNCTFEMYDKNLFFFLKELCRLNILHIHWENYCEKLCVLLWSLALK